MRSRALLRNYSRVIERAHTTSTTSRLRTITHSCDTVAQCIRASTMRCSSPCKVYALRKFRALCEVDDVDDDEGYNGATRSRESRRPRRDKFIVPNGFIVPLNFSALDERRRRSVISNVEAGSSFPEEIFPKLSSLFPRDRFAPLKHSSSRDSSLFWEKLLLRRS